MNSDPKAAAVKAFHQIVRLLDEELTARRIDAPLDNAVSTFKVPNLETIDTRKCDRILEDFVIHIRATGTYPRRHISRDEARSQATSLLSSPQISGDRLFYDNLLYAAVHGDISAVHEAIDTISEGIRNADHVSYRQWVHAACVETLTWEEKVCLVRHLLADHDVQTLDMARTVPPASLASELSFLLDTYISEKRTAAKAMVGMANGIF